MAKCQIHESTNHSHDHGFVTQAYSSILITLWITVVSYPRTNVNSTAPWCVTSEVTAPDPSPGVEFSRPKTTHNYKKNETYREGMVPKLVVFSLVPAQCHARYSGHGGV